MNPHLLNLPTRQAGPVTQWIAALHVHSARRPREMNSF